MIVAAVFSIALSLALGFLLQSFFRVRLPASQWRLSLQLGLSIGWGVGISSYAFFLWTAFISPTGRGFILFEAGLLLAAGIAFAVATRRARPPIADQDSASISLLNEIGPILLLGLAAAAGLSAVAFVSYAAHQPHGEWDAWAIWNQRARFLVRSGEDWRRGFSVLLADYHPDYPLLLPAMVARIWRSAGTETLLAPVALSMLFTFGTVSVAFSALGVLRGRWEAALAVFALLGTPFFIYQGAWQYADVPLSFFFLSTLALLCLHDHFSPRHNRLLILAGASAALAAWTKNEGLLFLPAVALAWCASSWLSGTKKRSLREAISFAAGALPGLLIILYFKLAVAPPNDLVAAQGLAVAIEHLSDPSRYLEIARGFLSQASLIGFSSEATPGRFDGWGIFPVLLPLYWLAMRVSRPARAQESDPPISSGALLPFLAAALMLAGYILAYLLTPYPLAWHLDTSLSRLLLHLWPTLVFALLLDSARPGEAGASRADS